MRVLEDVVLGIQSSSKGQIGQTTLVLGNQRLLSRPGGVGQAWETLHCPGVKGEAETRGTHRGGCWRWELGTEDLGRGKRAGKVQNLTDQGEKGVQNALGLVKHGSPHLSSQDSRV